MLNRILLVAVAISWISFDLGNCQVRTSDALATTELRFEKAHNGDGNYGFGFKTSNGINVDEKGRPVNTKEGCFSYTSPEGAFVSMIYISDEKGTKPKTRVTYPKDTVRHMQHLADPCNPNFLSNKPATTTNKGPTPPPSTAGRSEPGPAVSTTAPSSGKEGCASECDCSKTAPPSFKLRLKDGSSVVVSYVLEGERYQAEAKVYAAGSSDYYVSKPAS